MNRIEIYTSRYCPYCIAAKKLLLQRGMRFTEIDVSSDSMGRANMETRAKGRMTVPQIFIGSIHVGGYDDLRQLEQTGRLDDLLAGEGVPASAQQEPRA